MAAQHSTTYDNLLPKNINGDSVAELRKLDFQGNERLHLIPTIDDEVRAALTLLQEPETLDDEDAFMRRERLAELILKYPAHRATFESSISYENDTEKSPKNEEEEEEEEEFYTPASGELVSARKFLIGYSLDRAKQRLRKESLKAQTFNLPEELKKRRQTGSYVKNIELIGSQVVSRRPVCQVALSPNEDYVAAASWAGDITLLDKQSLKILDAQHGAFTGKVGGMDWGIGHDMLVAGGEDGLVKVFAMHNNQLRNTNTYEGHENRVAATKFHPSGNYIASASFDMTWRLWDVESRNELLLQEGHSQEIYSLAFQCDGALLCTAGLDSMGLVWDLRSGKRTTVLSGHAQPIYSVDWSPNGYQVVTGSGDGTLKIWDLRKSEHQETILAHNSIVTRVKFDKSGCCLISCGYDKAINLYSTDNWLKLTTLQGHMDKILCSDIAEGASSVVSSGWDRSVKLWRVEN
ncbi:PRP4 (YPR178W) [Zygosaccharomyces parabailii]|nr:PRP4 (YPR178W) [Zygosaccharomyces parabailii]CDH10548.1 related to U4/U6 small nuclear ribonucleoprotein PRP4 [Zygosaccharomyces bailii ISA1307]